MKKKLLAIILSAAMVIPAYSVSAAELEDAAFSVDTVENEAFDITLEDETNSGSVIETQSDAIDFSSDIINEEEDVPVINESRDPVLADPLVSGGSISDSGEISTMSGTSYTLAVSGTCYYARAASMLSYINSERASKGLNPLVLDFDLTENAMQRCAECNVAMSHTRPDGTMCFSLDSNIHGENIAAGYDTTLDTFNQWKNSPGHYANMMNEDFKSIGIGCFSKNNGMFYWTQLFSYSNGSGGCNTIDKDASFSVTIQENGSGLYFKNVPNKTINAGDTFRLIVKRTNPDWTDVSCEFDPSSFTWTSDNENAATVDENGLITGVDTGSAVITATPKIGNGGAISTTVNVYKENISQITYELDGGTNNPDNPSSYVEGKKFITLLDPVKKGYTFGGWFDKPNYLRRVVRIEKSDKGDITFYAKWTANKYKIKFYANGGMGSMSEITATYDKSRTLSTNKFKRSYYTFAGWNTKKDGSGTAYADKASVKNLTSTSGKTVKLYAQWKPVEYKISYYLNGGTNSKNNPKTYTKFSSNITLKKPTRTGYTFKGWYSDKKLTKKITKIKAGSSGNKKVYAKWQANSYTIKFNANGGTGTMKDISAVYGSAVTLKSNSFKKRGYSFNGWNTKEDGTGESFENKASVSNLVTKNNGSITLYVQWRPATTCNITYVLNGCENNPDNPDSYMEGVGAGLLYDPKTVPDGYYFEGWYVDSEYETEVRSIDENMTGDLTIYAHLVKKTLKPYTVILSMNDPRYELPDEYSKYDFDLNLDGLSDDGWTNDKVAKSFKAGEECTVSLLGYSGEMTKYYKLRGWNTDRNNKGTFYPAGTKVMFEQEDPDEPIKLYAIWVPKYTSLLYLATESPYREEDESIIETSSFDLGQAHRGVCSSGAKKHDESVTIVDWETACNQFFGGSTRAKVYEVWEFDSWNTEKDGSGTRIMPGEVWKISDLETEENLDIYADGCYLDHTKAVRLYAQLTLKQHKISYMLNGGENDPSNPTTYTYFYAEKYFKNVNPGGLADLDFDKFLKPAHKDGYKFLYWQLYIFQTRAHDKDFIYSPYDVDNLIFEAVFKKIE